MCLPVYTVSVFTCYASNVIAAELLISKLTAFGLHETKVQGGMPYKYEHIQSLSQRRPWIECQHRIQTLSLGSKCVTCSV